MSFRVVCFMIVVVSCTGTSPMATDSGEFSWRTGHDGSTLQLIPSMGDNPIVEENGKMVMHVKFRVEQYGEVSFPINRKTPEGAEALRADLSKSEGITISYQANHKFILQLRQTGVHGGVHNHIFLPSSEQDTTVMIPFTEFKGGKTPLDLTDVAKFNFAFLSNSDLGYAELKINHIEIDGDEK